MTVTAADVLVELDDGQVRPRGGAALPALDDDQVDRRQDLLVPRIPVSLHGDDVHDRDVVGAFHQRRQIERQHQGGAGGGRQQAERDGDGGERCTHAVNDTAESPVCRVTLLWWASLARHDRLR